MSELSSAHIVQGLKINDLERELAALRAEVARLRAALMSIRHTADEWDALERSIAARDAWLYIERMGDMALDAAKTGSADGQHHRDR